MVQMWNSKARHAKARTDNAKLEYVGKKGDASSEAEASVSDISISRWAAFHSILSCFPRGANNTCTCTEEAGSCIMNSKPPNPKGLKYSKSIPNVSRQSKTLFNDFLLVSNTSLTSIDDLLLAHAGNCEKGR